MKLVVKVDCLVTGCCDVVIDYFHKYSCLPSNNNKKSYTIKKLTGAKLWNILRLHCSNVNFRWREESMTLFHDFLCYFIITKRKYHFLKDFVYGQKYL